MFKKKSGELLFCVALVAVHKMGGCECMETSLMQASVNNSNQISWYHGGQIREVHCIL